MTSILDDLYNGDIQPSDTGFVKGSEYNLLFEAVIKSRKSLEEHLDESKKELFKQFIDAEAEMNKKSDLEKFVMGFKIGLRIGIESMMDDRDLRI